MNRKKILVVDDEIDIRESLAEILKSKNYAVISAQNGQEALNLLQAQDQPPELIILDLFMPVMDGKTFCNRIAQDPKMNSVPILAVSGTAADFPSLPKPLKIFPKPFTVRQLLVAMNELLEPHQNAPTKEN